MGMTLEAVKVRRDYKRKYRCDNRDRINAQQREWRSKNPDKVREYQKRYWEKQAEKRNIRASWSDYGISKERRRELQDIAKSDENAEIVLDCAIRADRKSAEHIVLSVVEGLSYEHVEFHEKLGRCPLGRSDFYGARRLFFHYLDMELKNSQHIQGVEVNE